MTNRPANKGKRQNRGTALPTPRLHIDVKKTTADDVSRDLDKLKEQVETRLKDLEREVEELRGRVDELER